MPSFATKQPRGGGAMSRSESAKYLGISTRKLDDLLSAGELRRVKIGRKTVVLVKDLDDFLVRKAVQK